MLSSAVYFSALPVTGQTMSPRNLKPTAKGRQKKPKKKKTGRKLGSYKWCSQPVETSNLFNLGLLAPPFLRCAGVRNDRTLALDLLPGESLLSNRHRRNCSLSICNAQRRWRLWCVHYTQLSITRGNQFNDIFSSENHRLDSRCRIAIN